MYALAIAAVLAGCAGCVRDDGHVLAAKLGIPRPAVIAHRGASYLAPEETRPAYVLARDWGADYLEMDVQRTKDHVLVGLHDDSLERTTDVAARFERRNGGFAVGGFTWAELQRLDAGSWFDRAHPRRARSSHAAARVLSLDELIDVAESGAHRPGLCIETKSALRYPGIERELVATLRRRGWIGGDTARAVLFESFVPQSLESLRALAPEVPRLLLAERGTAPGPLLDAAARLGAGCAPHALDLLAHPTFVARAHRRGMLVYPWVLDERWQMAFAGMLGADGFFTNRADVASRIRRHAALTTVPPHAPEGSFPSSIRGEDGDDADAQAGRIQDSDASGPGRERRFDAIASDSR